MKPEIAATKASKAFAQDHAPTTWRMLLVTLAGVALLEGALVSALPWPAKLPLSILLGLLQVRLFAFFHDFQHGALLRESRLAGSLMAAIGTFLLTVPSVWRETHDFHHANNSKLAGSSIGSFPIVSLAAWSEMDQRRRRAYRRARHPLTLLLGYPLVFLWGMNLAPFLRSPRRHWSALLALAVHGALVLVLGWTLGWPTALVAVVVPMGLCHAVGSYLFFAQHNFVGVRFSSRAEWSHGHAALHASSMFDMSPVMRWFTGNIGYHHVHHLNHRIPFYRLPEAMAGIEALQHPSRTSWRDIPACLRLGIWDPARGRMIGYREADSTRSARP